MSHDEIVQGRRRNLLALGAASASLLGLSAQKALGAAGPTPMSPPCPKEMSLALLRDYRTAKASSYDRTGGNADSRKLEVGKALKLMEADGPGVVSHIWFTVASTDSQHLKRLILRMFWDGESAPSVEVPIGDFFGLNLGEFFSMNQRS